MEKINNLKNEAIGQILEAKDEKTLGEIQVRFLGRQGKFNELSAKMADLPDEKKATVGKLFNEAKRAVEEALLNTSTKIILNEDKDDSWFDVTEAGIKPLLGHLHLVTQAIREIGSIFTSLGFRRARYPEVEWDWYAFEGLNMVENHPARDEWETFFIQGLKSPKYGVGVLTPHTSSGQLREMETFKPPLRMINIAKCYRRQSDISHAPMFYQFEGLVVDKDIAITHLKGTLDYFARNFFGPKRKTRIRPFHFQFTEPSFEVDVSCGLCAGKGCRFCKAGWLELGGAGMVHPTVLKNGGIDPAVYTGFALGWGVERCLMMKEGLKIDDIRLLYANDFRFLSQF